MRMSRHSMVAVLFGAGAGCLTPNADYRPPPDLAECLRDPTAGGGGKDRPEVLVTGGTFDYQGTTATMTDFLLDVYLVTVRAYRECFGNGTGPCSEPSTQYATCNWTKAEAGKEDHPINCITWMQADTFCRWAKPSGRLPTHAELQYAAGGPQPSSRYAWGNDDPQQTDNPARLCWSSTSGGLGTCPVGSFPKTLLGRPTCRGVFDLAGNVWEWTGSESHRPYTYPQPPCTTMSARCLLPGGAWLYTNAEYFLATSCDNEALNSIADSYGARCARSP